MSCRSALSAWLFIVVHFVVLALCSNAVAANNLPTVSDSMTENFTSADYFGLIYHWGDGGPITLPAGLGKFQRQSRNPQGWKPSQRVISGLIDVVPAWGYPNSTVLLSGQNGVCRIDRYQHSTNDNYPQQDTVIWAVYHASDEQVMTNIPCNDDSIMITNDVNGDGIRDYVIFTPQNLDWDGQMQSVIAYVAYGNRDHPSFTSVDLTSIFRNNNVAIHAPGHFAWFADANYDGVSDLYVLSSSGSSQQLLLFYGTTASGPWGLSSTPIVAIKDLGFRTPIANASQGATFPTSCTSGVARGASAIILGDYDGDFVLDAVVASPSDQNLHFFHGLNSGEFIRGNDIINPWGGAQFLQSEDYDKDIYLDVMVGRGQYSCGSGDVGAGILYSQRLSGFFRPTPLFMPANSNTVSWINDAHRGLWDSVPGVYGQAADVFMGSEGSPSIGTQWFNVPILDRFQPYALGYQNWQQKGGQGLIKATINAPTSTPAGTSVTLHVSPDNGNHWEPVPPAEMNGSTPHYFYNSGNMLSFMVELRAPPSLETGSYAQLMPIANVTPKLTNISVAITGMAQASNFTRSNIIGATLGAGNSNRPITIAASYTYPGWDGHLVAYDLHTGDATSSNAVVATNTKPLWEAGALLKQRSGTSRILYSSYVQSMLAGSPNLNVGTLSRINFTQGEIDSPSTPSNVLTLRQALGWPPAFADGMMNGFRGGNNGSASTGTKLYDTGHGDPVFVGAPAQDANIMGASYTSWAASQASRRGVILKSSNAGMMHAFDANTGTELWGYVPHAQLQRIGDTAVYQIPSQTTTNRHHILVDGPTVSGDVYGGGAWRTIAIQGQSYGWSDSNNNFYFALDVTNPTNPVPLWEVTEPILSGQLTCDYNNLCKQLACSDNMISNANCLLQNGSYNEYFSITSSNRDENGQPYGAMQAESVHLLASGYGSSSGAWTIQSSTSSSKGSSAHNNAYLQAGGTSSTCSITSNQAASTCPRADYYFTVDTATSGTYYALVRQWVDGTQHKLGILIDDNLIFSGTPSLFSSSNNTWRWGSTGSAVLSAGLHKLSFVMGDPSLALDAFALRVNANSAPGTGATTTAVNDCDQIGNTPPCYNTCLADASKEWPECGVGAGLKCCAANGQSFCSAVNSSCSSPPSAMGQTFSKPALGRLRGTSGDIWAAFFASGYNVTNAYNVGRSIYAVDAYTGKPLGEWNLPDAPYSSSAPMTTTIPSGLALVDADNDGYVDRVYFGDTAGRLWKLNTYAASNPAKINALSSVYSTCLMFDAGDPTHSGTRIYAPITQTPAVAVVSGTTPNIYFGTGSSTGVAMSQQYSFYSIRDTDAMGSCNNSSKTSSSLSTKNLEWSLTDPTQGFRFWGDPTVVDNAIVYFSSMYGDPDWLASADNSSTQSHVYARAIQDYVDTTGASHAASTSVLAKAVNYVTAAGSIRSALVGAGSNTGSTSGTSGANTVSRGNKGIQGTPATNLYANNLAGDVMRITTTGTQQKLSHLRRVGWREVLLPASMVQGSQHN